MKYIEDFSYTGATFEEMISAPDAFTFSVGSVTISFSILEDRLSEKISLLLGMNESQLGEIITSEMPFRGKVNALASLLRRLLPTTRFNTGTEDSEVIVRDMIKSIRKCEELRNRIMHSSWEGSYYRDGKVERRKVTAKSRHGHREQVEELTPGMIQDISDFIIYVDHMVDQFFYIVEPKN